MNASPLRPNAELVKLHVPDSDAGLLNHARTMLRKAGYNCKKVYAVFPASHPVGEGRETLLFETYGENRKTAFISRKRERIRVEVEEGWLTDP